MNDKPNTDGRKANAAQPLGERGGVTKHHETMKTGKESTRRAGPDGPDAGEAARLQNRPER